MSALHIPDTRKIAAYSYGSDVQSTASRYLGTQIDFRTGVSSVAIRTIATIFNCDHAEAEEGIALLFADEHGPWSGIVFPDGGSVVAARLRKGFEADPITYMGSRLPTAPQRAMERQRNYIASLNRTGREMPPWEQLDTALTAPPAPAVITIRKEPNPGRFMEQTAQN